MTTVHSPIIHPESGEVIAEPGVITNDLGIDRVLNLVFQFPERFKVLAFLPEGYIAGADNQFDFEIHSFVVPPSDADIEALLNHFARRWGMNPKEFPGVGSSEEIRENLISFREERIDLLEQQARLQAQHSAEALSRRSRQR